MKEPPTDPDGIRAPVGPSRPGGPNGGPAIDAVLFDLGQVLVGWDPYLPYVGRLDRPAVEAFFDEIDFPAFNHLQDAGRSWAEARAALHETHPHRVVHLDIYVEHFDASLTGPVPGSAELVTDLRAAGLRLLGLTNWSAELYHHAERAAPAIGLLEDVLVSGEVGLAKPDPRIFTLVVARFGLTPERTLFVDDTPVNVTAAAASGLIARPFVDHDRLRAELRDLGVPVPARPRT